MNDVHSLHWTSRWYEHGLNKLQVRQERLVTGVLTTHIVSCTDKYGGVAVDVNFHHSVVWPPFRRFLNVVLCQLSKYCLKSAGYEYNV
jgi:hypothetical protein